MLSETQDRQQQHLGEHESVQWGTKSIPPTLLRSPVEAGDPEKLANRTAFFFFFCLSHIIQWKCRKDPKHLYCLPSPHPQFLLQQPSLLINTGSAEIFTFSLLDSCGFERIQVLAGCQGIQITSQAAHCPESATAASGGKDTRKGQKPFPVLIVTLPGRPLLFVKFESFLALRTEDQARNPLPDGSAGRCLVAAALWQPPGCSWWTADQRALGPLAFFHKIFLGQARMKPSGSWQGCLRCTSSSSSGPLWLRMATPAEK